MVVDASTLFRSPGLAEESEMVGREDGERLAAVPLAWCCCMARRACWVPVSLDLGLPEKSWLRRLPLDDEGRLSPGLTG